MLPLVLILTPAAGALVGYTRGATRWRSKLLALCALAHTVLVALVWLSPNRGGSALGGWLAVDALGLVVLTLVSIVFLAVSHYAMGYMRRDGGQRGRIFVTCLLSFLAAATVVALSHHLALLWIGMEATTLAIAPLIFDRHDRHSLEAVWKYLMLSSVGIAFALLGVFLLATAQPSGVLGGRPLMLDDMIASAAYLDAEWLKLAFVFIAIGFGTKMGLAPMHSWKPDTYSQAPSLVAGLMAGALTSCAFLGLARVCAISFAAGLGDFVRPVLIGFGLLSLLIAAAFIITQRDVKRLLAYSSVEHMGLLVIGVGVGGAGAYGAVLHSLNNGLAKCLLFLAVGNVVLAYGTSSVLNIRGLVSAVPRTAVLLVVGLVAVTGSPPFGLFISEFSILSGAFAGHFAWVGALTIFLLVVIFVGMGKMILDMVYGAPHPADPAKPRDHTLIAAADRSAFTLAPAVLAFLVLMLGVFIPAPLARVLTAAAAHLGGGTP